MSSNARATQDDVRTLMRRLSSAAVTAIESLPPLKRPLGMATGAMKTLMDRCGDLGDLADGADDNVDALERANLEQNVRAMQEAVTQQGDSVMRELQRVQAFVFARHNEMREARRRLEDHPGFYRRHSMAADRIELRVGEVEHKLQEYMTRFRDIEADTGMAVHKFLATFPRNS